MFVQMLRAKLHHARVTGADPDYVGSITIDADLLDQVGMLPYEWVLVADVENGNRLETYVISGKRGSGVIQLNGAAAHLVKIGDRVIIFALASVPIPLEEPWQPKVAVLGPGNRITHWVKNGQVQPVNGTASTAPAEPGRS